MNIFGNVVERCPIITAAVWPRRPFASLSALETAISEFIDSLPESGEAQFHRFLLNCLFQLCFNVWVVVGPWLLFLFRAQWH